MSAKAQGAEAGNLHVKKVAKQSAAIIGNAKHDDAYPAIIITFWLKSWTMLVVAELIMSAVQTHRT